MKFIHILLFSSFLAIGCSGHHLHNYERDYKHKIVKVVPEERGKAVTVVVHHQGKLTPKEKKFLRKHFSRKKSSLNHGIRVNVEKRRCGETKIRFGGLCGGGVQNLGIEQFGQFGAVAYT